MNADGSGLRRLTRGSRVDVSSQLVWSPDGRTIYFGRYLVSTDGSGSRRLPYIPLTAVWSPDGRRIAFVGCRLSGRRGLSVPSQPGDLRHERRRERIPQADAQRTYDAEPAWSPDGRKIAFQSTRNGNREIYVMNADGSGKRNLTRNPAQDGRPSWSPDGRRIAFVSDRDGRLEAHVMNADGSGQRSLTQRSP